MTFVVTSTIVRPRYRSVALMANLRRTTGQDGDHVVLHGYHVPGEGGQVYWWDSSSTAGDNGGDIIVVGRGRWIAVPNSAPLSVRDFGAKGDGTTDDYAAIWECIKRATDYGASTGKPGAVYLPRPTGSYALETPIDYRGRGEALNIIGEAGGMLAWGGSILKWIGDTSATVLTIGGSWCGTLKNFDIDANSRAQTALHLHSTQDSGGTGLQGFVVDHVGAYDVKHDSADPVVVRIGDSPTVGTTDQVDLSRFEMCRFRGSFTHPEDVTIWRLEEAGNVCNFAFVGGAMYYGRYGIDAAKGSGPISVTDVTFAQFNDGDDGTDAACMRFGEQCRASVRSTNCESTIAARFIESGTMGSSGSNGLEVTSCVVEMVLPPDNGVIRYVGPVTLRNNSFGGATSINDDTVAPRIIISPLRIGVESPSGSTPGSVVSEGNFYGYMPSGSYAPFYNGDGTPATGPDSYDGDSRYYGLYRTPIYSRGDTAIKAGTATAIALEPWDGAIAHNVKTWAPGAIADGAKATTTHDWETADGASVLNGAPHVEVTFSQLLPVGVALSCGRSAAGTVWAMIKNDSGAPFTPDGTLTFTARAA